MHICWAQLVVQQIFNLQVGGREIEPNTEKMLINVQAFIRIITFLWEGYGHLLEAILEMA